MSTIQLHAERVMRAPAEIVYACIADYRQHHRPGGFLPPVFTDLQVEQGGVGAGTAIRFTTRLGGTTRVARQDVSEPEPGRVLVEAGSGAQTTFTVDQLDERRCRVRIDSQLELSRGLRGVIERLVIPRLLMPVYRDELARLEARVSGLLGDSASASSSPSQP